MSDRPDTTVPAPDPGAEPEPDWSWVDEIQEWVPPAVDTSRPSVARIYDYGLGGKDNYPVDREAAHRFFEVVPDSRDIARANRDFLSVVVTEMAAAGIDQFLDLGSGLPTSPNVHETARLVHPGAAVVYVDNDPVVLAHNRAMLLDDDRVITLNHDLREPASILRDPAARRVLDLSRPVGVLLISVLHFVGTTAAPAVISRYVEALPPGSLVAVTATTSLGIDPEVLRQSEETYTRVTGTALVHRTRAEIERLFEGTELLRPLADVYRSPTIAMLGGLGVKR